MWKRLKGWAFLLLLVGLLVGSICWDAYVWRAKHPDAPTWTFFFSSSK